MPRGDDDGKYRELESQLEEAGIPCRGWILKSDGRKHTVRWPKYLRRKHTVRWPKQSLMEAWERVRLQRTGAAAMISWHAKVAPAERRDLPVPDYLHWDCCACSLHAASSSRPRKEARRTLRNVHYFWHWATAETEALPPFHLPDNAVEGLASALAIGYRVYFWCYQPLQRVPEGVALVDAGSLFGEQSAERVLRGGTNVANLADYIRAKAMLKYGGIFCDVDTLWFKQFPEGFLGHAIASFEARRDPRHKTLDQAWALVKYLREPNDFLYIATPVQAPRGSPWTTFLVQGLEKQFGGVPPEEGGIDPSFCEEPDVDPMVFLALVPLKKRPERVQSSHTAKGYDILGVARSVFAKGGLFPIAVHRKKRA